MYYQLLFRQSVKLACLLSCVVSLATPTTAQGQAAEKKDSDHKLRIICVASLSKDQEVTLASRDEKGAWQEYSTFKLRSPLITEWLPVNAGELHIAQRGTKELVSICRFIYPEDARRALLVLFPDSEKNVYRASVINPDKMKYAKGSVLIVNCSPTPGVVMLGAHRTLVKPGEKRVVKPEPETNGMLRFLVAYTDKADNLIPCHDRYIPDNVNTRDLLLLLPDPVAGMRVVSFQEYGPFE